MARVSHYCASVCYLKKDERVLMIKFHKKWKQVYAPPGGKFEHGESPFDCVIREFKEETGLELISPRLQGVSYWCDNSEGIIFIYVAEEAEGELLRENDEGILEWVDLKDLANINQFPQNKIFTPYLFKEKLFEGKFIINAECEVLKYDIREV